ncbi:MAG: nitroreductase [Butyrivibrio sp.]|nr:nitroreductase [Butyrivibrio sp.]
MGEFLELAKSRKSVRTFDKAKLSDEVLNELKQYTRNISNPYDLPVKFVFLDKDENDLSSPVLSGEKTYVSGVIKKSEHAAEAFGYSFEDFIMHAHENNIATVWIGAAMPRDKFELATGLAANDLMPCMTPIGYAAKKKSLKETLMRKGVKADSRKNFIDLFFMDDFSNPMSEDKAEELGLKDALVSVQVAPSAVNKQPWRIVITDNAAHFYIKHDKGFETPDYDVQRIDMGIALYHFEKELLSEGKEVKFEIKDPGITAPSGVDYVATYRW